MVCSSWSNQYHVMLGLGVPLAKHENWTFEPSRTLFRLCRESSLMRGGTRTIISNCFIIVSPTLHIYMPASSSLIELILRDHSHAYCCPISNRSSSLSPLMSDPELNTLLSYLTNRTCERKKKYQYQKCFFLRDWIFGLMGMDLYSFETFGLNEIIEWKLPFYNSKLVKSNKS